MPLTLYDNFLYHTCKMTMVPRPWTASATPQRRPVILAVSFDEADAAIGRLLRIALPATRAAETGASAKVADFLLAWWNGDECGHFPILHLCNVDAVIAEDMLTVKIGRAHV